LILRLSKGVASGGPFWVSLLQQIDWRPRKDAEDVRLQRAVADRFYVTLHNISLSMVVLFLVMSLYRCFIIQWQWSLGGTEAIKWKSYDVCLLVSIPACLIFLHCRWLASPRLLDARYLFFNGILLWVLAIDPCGYIDTNSLKLSLSRLILGVTTKHFALAVVGNTAFSAMVIYDVTLHKTPEQVNGLIGVEVTDLLLLLFTCFVVRWQLWANARMGINLHSSSVELSAVCRLLTGLCDAVLVLDDSLQLTENSAPLSTLLLHGYGAAGANLAGKDFLGYFNPEDRKHVRDALSASACSTLPAMALNASLQDALGNAMKVELLHLRFERAGGESRYLVGIREYQDFSHFVAPLGETPTSSTGMGSKGVDQTGVYAAKPREKDRVDRVSPREILVFDASSLEILHAADEVRDCCADLGFADPEQNSLYDISVDTTDGQPCLVAQVQQAINMTGNRPSPEIHFENLELCGSIKVDVMRLEFDEALEILVGTLGSWEEPFAVRVDSTSSRSESQLRRRRSRSGGSRSSKRSLGSRSRRSSRSQRSTDSYPSLSKDGDILALHGSDSRVTL